MRLWRNKTILHLEDPTEILLANIPALNAKHERLAVEIVKLAEKRHEELIR
jgi:type I restriction enzyme, R subunit